MEEIPIKRTISLILALILFCTLPGMFASDEADNYDHDHDAECDCEICHGDSQLRYDYWCDVCGNYSSLTWECVQQWFESYEYDSSCHLVCCYYAYFCTGCWTMVGDLSYTDSLEGHSSEWDETRGCYYCPLCGATLE